MGSKYKQIRSRETEQPQVIRKISTEALVNLKRPLEGDIWIVTVKEIHAKGDAIAPLPMSGMICIIKERIVKPGDPVKSKIPSAPNKTVKERPLVPGDIVRVKIVKVKDKYCFGKFATEE